MDWIAMRLLAVSLLSDTALTLLARTPPTRVLHARLPSWCGAAELMRLSRHIRRIK